MKMFWFVPSNASFVNVFAILFLYFVRFVPIAYYEVEASHTSTGRQELCNCDAIFLYMNVDNMHFLFVDALHGLVSSCSPIFVTHISVCARARRYI